MLGSFKKEALRIQGGYYNSVTMPSYGVETDVKNGSTCRGQSVIKKPAVAQNLLWLEEL